MKHIFNINKRFALFLAAVIILGFAIFLLVGIGKNKQQACVQAITPAMSPEGECKEFSTPCDVPEGWNKTEKCPEKALGGMPAIPATPIK